MTSNVVSSFSGSVPAGPAVARLRPSSIAIRGIASPLLVADSYVLGRDSTREADLLQRETAVPPLGLMDHK